MLLRCFVALCCTAVIFGCVPVSEVSTTNQIEAKKPKYVKLMPSYVKYPFIKNDENVGAYSTSLYKNADSFNRDNLPYLRAKIVSPAGYIIKFENYFTAVEINETTTYQMNEGVYPFVLIKPGDASARLSGAIAVFNVDKTLELATFGLTEGTLLFNPEMIKQAENGVLASYTISFDGKKVMHYWVGNRESSAPNLRSSVELDFTGNGNIEKMKIAGKILEKNKVVLDVPTESFECSRCGKVGARSAFADRCPKGGAHRIEETGWAKVDYPVEFELKNGQRYKGYVRKLGTNAFTSFLSIPCDIPENLLQLASKGTIAKLSVYTSQDNEHEIAEIVFGLAK